MKKVLILVLALLMVFPLVSCGNAYNNALEQLYSEIPSGYIYTSAQLEELTKTHDAHGHFKGKILSFADFSTIDINGIPLCIYVCEFELEEDALYWYNNHTIGWTYAIIEDNVVVYGSNKLINELDL